VGEEENIKQQLIQKFGFLSENISVPRTRRIFAIVPTNNFRQVFEYAIKELGFVILCTITGLDEGPTLGFIYHLAKENGVMLNLHISVAKEKPVIKTISNYFPAADAYERELVDLLGAQVEGLPAGNRYPLPDDWPANQYPLRKDWKGKVSEITPVTPDSQANHGVEVKENA
jgi:Ni,Fe-hydrogenase III component G